MNNKIKKVKNYEKLISQRFINVIDLYDIANSKNNLKEGKQKDIFQIFFSNFLYIFIFKIRFQY